MTTQFNHAALYGVIFVMSLATIAAGALVLGYTKSSKNTYKFSNTKKGFSEILLALGFDDSTTYLEDFKFIETDNEGQLLFPEAVVDIEFKGGTLSYSTGAGKGLLAAGILGIIGGGAAFIICCVGFYYSRNPSTNLRP